MDRKLALALALSFTIPVCAQTELKYQQPPAAIEQLLDAPPTPTARVSPDRKVLLIEQPATFPTIADVAAPRYRLAGIRFNPVISGPSVVTYDIALKLQPVAGGEAKAVTGLPAKLKASDASFSPDAKHIAFVRTVDAPATMAGQELWVIDVATAAANRVGAVHLNSILGHPCEWLPDSTGLLCKTVPATRGAAPKETGVPTGPHVQENLGTKRPAPTYEDLLKTPEDAAIFEYYATSQLAVVSLGGVVKPLAVKGVVEGAKPSPDGHYAMVSLIHRPFSYTIPYERFPQLTEIASLKGSASPHVLQDRPAVDDLPISRDAVQPGPRDYSWRSDAPSTVVWVEAADNGDPKMKTNVRDRVKALPAPFTGEATTLVELAMRVQRGFGAAAAGPVQWGNEHLALVTESRWADRKTAIVAFDPSTPDNTTMLYEGSSQDRYHSPGRPMTESNAAGHPVLQLTPDGSGIYFSSEGASPKGDFPFVGVMPIAGGKESVLFHSVDPYYAQPVALLAGNTQLLVRREAATESPNYFAATLKAGAADFRQVTHFASPYAGIAMPTHQLLHYKRADGVELTATLWLPAGYDKSQGPLPTLIEAYPAEFKTRAAAAQVTGSTNRFPSFGWGGSPVYFAQNGYAVMENAAIPIIGEGDKEPNDTYVEQLVEGAKAAVEAGVATGTVDRNRIGVMGHSYGAFMTANLLAHTDIFRAGIARSGAYNRSLTPFGFQNEERTYWQAPQVYFEMSPFSYADKIKTPILLIHGEADDNTGTFPIQSERLYAALQGQGATVRLVFLPLEPHHYGAHESLQHMLWEMNRWLDTYVKPMTPAVAPAKND
ncbi:glutamyl peptidase. Serine peptidase. MEROPS family S09D [Bryocella elongata]|uniref:Glutamyl peptidase. Serine peptidase. MEROPS family S09D n=1 Tax=Bryocella elongata TaxID=863522 RepID=A0A1H5XU93_9BACT|nr:prolyl oligopeptidase family serine peptidase [Bryocella elongata]SEG15349.1 glutamyl peptidase. Serine peptidase. MEROPS family S09D [Bryocella elongata]